MLDDQQQINEENELLNDEIINRFSLLTQRFDFSRIKKGYEFSLIWYSKKHLMTYNKEIVLSMIQESLPIIDLTFEDLQEFNELIEGTVDEFLIAFHRLYFIEKIQNQI